MSRRRRDSDSCCSYDSGSNISPSSSPRNSNSGNSDESCSRHRPDSNNSPSHNSHSSNDSRPRSSRGNRKSSDKKENSNDEKNGFPLQKDVKFIAKSANGDKYLSAHCYYSKDCPSDSSTKLMVEQRNLEGQIFKISSNFENIFEIIYDSEDYNMKNWKISLKTNPIDQNALDPLIIEKSLGNGFLIKKKPDSTNFYIQDALTSYYLNESENAKRDDYSNYIVAEKDPKTEWEISLLEKKN